MNHSYNKLIIIISFLTLSLLSFSQNINENLQGDWVCTGILDLNGIAASGKFGGSSEYLKFSFKNNDLTIREVPFDKGVTLIIQFGDGFFDIFPEAVGELPERVYFIKKMEGDSLILSTINEDYKKIDYHFLRQKKYLDWPENGAKILDNGIILIKHFETSKDLRKALHISEYRLSNDEENLFPSPIFADPGSTGFGPYLSANIVYPKSFHIGSVSEEMIVSFEVTDEGAINLRVNKGISDELDAAVLKAIRGSRKKWQPLKIDGQTQKVIMRFHLLFLQASENSQDDFKTGVDFVKKGKYALADTFFTKQIRQYPYDRDALFNRAALRLLHKDTCTFCNDLYTINSPFDTDKEALEKYLKLCVTTDTICYYDKNFFATNSKDFRYYEVLEKHKFINKDPIIGKIHDTKRKYTITSFNSYWTGYITTDLTAIYTLGPDGHKIYLFTSSEPKFPGGWDSHLQSISNSPHLQQLKRELKIPGAYIYYTYIIGTDGKAKDFKINIVYPEVDKEELLKQITRIYSEMPDFKPGKFGNEPVDFIISQALKF